MLNLSKEDKQNHIDLLNHDWQYDENSNTYSHEILVYPKNADLNQAILAHKSMIAFFMNDEKERLFS